MAGGGIELGSTLWLNATAPESLLGKAFYGGVS